MNGQDFRSLHCVRKRTSAARLCKLRVNPDVSVPVRRRLRLQHERRAAAGIKVVEAIVVRDAAAALSRAVDRAGLTIDRKCPHRLIAIWVIRLAIWRTALRG